MLEIKEIWKTFNAGTVNEKQALRGVSLTLKDGDFCTVIGGNGAGKSTMLKEVAVTCSVDSGAIVIGGGAVTLLPEHKRAKFIGRVFQDPMMGTAPTMQIEENLALAARRGQPRGLGWGILPEHKRAKFIGRVFQDPMMGTAPTMQIEENLALAARRGQPRGLGWGITKTERADYRELLRDLGLGLEDRLTSKVGLLSGGQRQALTLLMASLKRPKLLLLDEHTAALDPKTAAKVLALSDRIVEENGLTTMMVTHNMKDAIVHGNRLIMMYDGRIVIDVSGEEKKKLTVPDLLALFSKVSGSDEADDKLLLS